MPLAQRQPVEEEEEEPLQAKEAAGRTSAMFSALESTINTKRGTGSPLDADTRDFFEPRFDYDFSNARALDGFGQTLRVDLSDWTDTSVYPTGGLSKFITLEKNE
jgi:hypothetical protein